MDDMKDEDEDLADLADDCENGHCPLQEEAEEMPLLPTSRSHGQLTQDEKKFLLSVERGDLATVRRYLQKRKETCLNVNCVDPLGRSAMLMAIDNENLEMVELLIEYRVDTKDALLHAISEEYVEAVEVLLEHEEANHIPGEPYSWEAIDRDTATFTPDVTPLILAAHRDNYEIVKILLDRGSALPDPHDVRCSCSGCVQSRSEDSLRHSRSRINSYRALASPSLIALSSKDPILTAFELGFELRRLSFLEHEFKTEYQDLRRQCQEFATAVLDHTRSSYELEVLLNYDPTGPAFEHGNRMHLSRLKLAIKHKQKKFCAHPNVQQLLASIWYEGLPGFRRKNIVLQTLEICRIGTLFPLYSIAYILSPHSNIGRTLRRPFVKFICHSASYVTFLFLLILASQRIETVISGYFGNDDGSGNDTQTTETTKRGAPPSVVEWMILAWVIGLIWSEIKELWELGLREYIADMWNIIDFITNAFYVTTIALRVVAYFQVQKELATNSGTAHLPRKVWSAWDPILISEGLFATANIFSSLKLVYIFSVNPHLGPLQICLGRMVIDIVKFFFVYTLVLFAFACGMNQLLWYYAEMEHQLCNKTRSDNSPRTDSPPCLTWRRFSNLFESIQTLFWASFGLIELGSFELDGIQSYTRFWGLLMFGSYCVINVVVLLNLLIAMMNHSYQMISEQADVEWKFARCKLWMSYFEDGATVPPPFNIIPTPKTFYYFCRWIFRKFYVNSRAARKEHLKTIRRRAKQACERDLQYQTIMRNLVRRYVTEEQRKSDNQGVTEDDVNEIKQDISSFRYELIEILKNSGFNTSEYKAQIQGPGGKKGRQKERRLMKGFDIGLVESSIQTTPEVSLDETNYHVRSSPGNKLARIAKLATRKAKRGRWSNIIEATKNARAAFSRSRSEDSLSSQVSSERRVGCSSRNDSSSSSSVDVPSEEKSKPDLPVIKRSVFARKLGNLALSTSKLRLAFIESSEKSSSIESHAGFKNKNHSNNSRDQAQRTKSAPFGQWLMAKSSSMDHIVSHFTSGGGHSLTPARSLSPIPSCASSNVPTPRSSITGQQDNSNKDDVFSARSGGLSRTPQGSVHSTDDIQPIPDVAVKGLIPDNYGIEPVSYPTDAGWI